MNPMWGTKADTRSAESEPNCNECWDFVGMLAVSPIG